MRNRFITSCLVVCISLFTLVTSSFSGVYASGARRHQWPTGGPVAVLERFSPPAQRWLAGHRGVDLALAAGSPVMASYEGVVAFSGVVATKPVVSIEHSYPPGLRTTYEPVVGIVKAGQSVRAGQVIGVLQAGHRSDGRDALHWGARFGRERYIDPLSLLRRPRIVLKPLARAGEVANGTIGDGVAPDSLVSEAPRLGSDASGLVRQSAWAPTQALAAQAASLDKTVRACANADSLGGEASCWAGNATSFRRVDGLGHRWRADAHWSHAYSAGWWPVRSDLVVLARCADLSRLQAGVWRRCGAGRGGPAQCQYGRSCGAQFGAQPAPLCARRAPPKTGLDPSSR